MRNKVEVKRVDIDGDVYVYIYYGKQMWICLHEDMYDKLAEAMFQCEVVRFKEKE